MKEIREKFDQLLGDVTAYLESRRDLYGDEIYSDFAVEDLYLTRKEKKGQLLSELHGEIRFCRKCQLSKSRRQVVFGSGNPDAVLMLIGEAPGQEEDMQGIPFVGPAGQLLTKILDAIHIAREEVYIANIIKCRPPQNRDPLPDEQQVCVTFLHQQIEIIQPKLILALGRISGQYLLNSTQNISELRGKVHHFREIPMMVTYHPAALLRNPEWKRETWEDVQNLQKLYEKLNG